MYVNTFYVYQEKPITQETHRPLLAKVLVLFVL